MQEDLQLLQELVQLTRVLVRPAARQWLESEFFEGGEPQQDRIRVYANLNGRAQREIADAAGVNQSSVSRWSKEWKRKGLVDEDGTAVLDFYHFFPELRDQA